ncbi:MAG: hypothetical protein RH862_14665 [Leptospiraceae bacterium]
MVNPIPQSTGARFRVKLPAFFRATGSWLLLLFFSVPAFADSNPQWRPPGYGPGQQVEGMGFGVNTGFKTIEDDYYITITPQFELPLPYDFRIGLQVPLEVLVYDTEPKTAEKVPDLRTGTYDSLEDYSQLITYVRKGTHGFYEPGEWNWSFYYGRMYDGYIGHRTIIDRYVSTYDPTIQSPGLMADINNDWGGVEYFQSNVLRKQVEAGRVYIRPAGIVASVYNGFFVSHNRGGGFSPTEVALSIQENNSAYYYEKIPKPDEGGALRQYRLNRLREDLQDTELDFEEYRDPVTNEVKVRPVEKPTGPDGPQDPSGPGDQGLQDPSDTPTDRDSDEWDAGFWGRWAVGYTVARDHETPLTLEYDGSNNLVVDPDSLRPRALETEDLYIVGMDTELKLSPYSWFDLTPYVDINKVKDLENSEGIHAGILFQLNFSLVSITLKPEYREVTSNYLPAYFDSYYAIERTVYIPETGDASTQTTTKLAYLKSLPTDGEKKKGFFIHGLLDFSRIFIIEMNYEDYDGPSNSEIFVGFYIPPTFGGLFLNGYYSKKSFEGFGNAFELDDNSLLAGEAGITFMGGLYIKGVFQRTWEYDTNEAQYLPVDETSVQFGFSSDI